MREQRQRSFYHSASVSLIYFQVPMTRGEAKTHKNNSRRRSRGRNEKIIQVDHWMDALTSFFDCVQINSSIDQLTRSRW